MKLQLSGLCLLTVFCFLLSGCTGKTERFLFEESEGKTEQIVSSAPAEETSGGEEASPVPEPETETQEEPEETAEIYVDICGAVRSPGVYILPEGSRVYSAVEAAGGFLTDAVPEAVNQAGILVDAQQIYIPTEEELAGGGPVLLPSGDEETALSSGTDDGRIDLNTAGVDQLCSLPGIGEAKAEAIIAYRDLYGPFGSPEELMNVSGIKEGTYAKIKEKISAG